MAKGCYGSCIAHLLGHRLDVGVLPHSAYDEFLGVVLSLYLRAELIAGGQCQWSLMVIEAYDGRKAPALLVAVQL